MFDSDAVMQFGLVNNLVNNCRTGNALIDTLFALVLPFILGGIIPRGCELLKYALEWVQHHLFSRQNTVASYTREIVFKRSTRWHEDNANAILQQAILEYVQRHRPEALTALAAAGYTMAGLYDYDSDDDSDDDGETTSVSDKWCNLITIPQDYVRVEVEHNLSMRRWETITSEAEGKNVSHRVYLTLESTSKDGLAHIEDFIQRSMQLWNKDKHARQSKRQLYLPVSYHASNNCSGDDDSGSSAPRHLYQSYQLSDDRTFSSWFHPEKRAVLQLLDAFMAKTGKYAIPGFPHKLGLLLYGPPGTGKTSFIKAMAAYTGRSIVSVPLARIKTNAELMDCMYAQSLRVQDEYDDHYAPFSKTIFIMEDIDAASGVVANRSASSMSGTCSKDDRTSSSDARSSTTLPAPNDCASNTPAACKTGSTTSGPAFLSDKVFMDSDSLNLAGLLNCLDGIIDTPGRIVVMTTNHPEKLDPALIRPGRINKKLLLGPLQATEASEMICHYFLHTATAPAASCQLPSKQQSQLEALLAPGRRPVTPAELESLCAEHDDVDSLLDAVACMQEKPASSEWQQQRQSPTSARPASGANVLLAGGDNGDPGGKRGGGRGSRSGQRRRRR